ncbi:MAG: glycosyltransferase family 2 protein, partial [Acidimicrobiales bacterium]
RAGPRSTRCRRPQRQAGAAMKLLRRRQPLNAGPADCMEEPLGQPAGRVTPNERPLVSVVVPAYNEAELIVDNLTTLCEYMDLLGDMYRWELIVVNDGSTDDTGPLADAFARSRASVRVMHHRTNLHLGQALRSAFGDCRGDYVVAFDCDLSYAPEHIGRLLTEIRTSAAKIVIASPYHPGGRTTNIPTHRRLLSRWANRFLSFMARGDVSTLTGMVRAYDGGFLRTLNLRSSGTEINTEILYKAQLLGAGVSEIPAHLDWTFQKTGGRRRASTMSLTSSANSYFFSGFMFRPVLFFIAPGMAMLFAATYTLAWVLWRTWDNFLSTTGDLDARLTIAIQGAFDDAPYAFVVGGITLMLAFQLISLGIIALQSERYFKELYHFNASIYRQVLGRRDDPE